MNSKLSLKDFEGAVVKTFSEQVPGAKITSETIVDGLLGSLEFVEAGVALHKEFKRIGFDVSDELFDDEIENAMTSTKTPTVAHLAKHFHGLSETIVK